MNLTTAESLAARLLVGEEDPEASEALRQELARLPDGPSTLAGMQETCASLASWHESLGSDVPNVPSGRRTRALTWPLTLAAAAVLAALILVPWSEDAPDPHAESDWGWIAASHKPVSGAGVIAVGAGTGSKVRGGPGGGPEAAAPWPVRVFLSQLAFHCRIPELLPGGWAFAHARTPDSSRLELTYTSGGARRRIWLRAGAAPGADLRVGGVRVRFAERDGVTLGVEVLDDPAIDPATLIREFLSP